jgi:hypothetical protein
VTSLLSGIGVSLFLAIVFTVLYALVEVLAGARREIEKESIPRTQPKIRSCVTSKYWLYVVGLIPFNLASTLLAWYELPRWFPEFFNQLGRWSFFIYAFVGVFLFQVLVTNTDIWIFSKGVMAFQRWASRVRTPAIAAAIEKESERDRDRQQHLTDALYPLVTEAELTTCISEIAGKEEADNIDAVAQDEEDPKLYKLLWLARRHPIAAQSMLKTKRESSQ